MAVMKKLIGSALLFLLFSGCVGKKDYERLSDGIVVHPEQNQAKLVRLQVLSDNVIHVTASAADTFSSAKSLMVLADLKSEAKWSTEESKGLVALVTPALRVEISLLTGEVVFKDSSGEPLLREQSGGGKVFTPSNADNNGTYQIRQVFESPDDEAFYGLGAHQNGQMNYKGQDVELVQHNIVDVVPFLYSNKNYGILWDNYSISKFGDPRDYESLNTLKLVGKDGKEGGLTAQYFVKDKIVRNATEDRIEYEFLETPQVDSFPNDVSANGKVIWEGGFSSDKPGLHKFQVYAAGYFKVWVDGKLIMDKWRQNWNPWTNKFTVNMQSGENHTIKIEWTPDGGRYMAVRHLDPLPVEEQQKLSISSEEGEEINYYFVRGKNADEVISGYRWLTGKAPIVPQWALGFWQSRERYHNQQELIDVVKEYRKRKIPLDNIVLDWQYWQDPKWGSHEFDSTRFPDPAGMVKKLHEDLHANIMISVWPKFNKGTKNYEEMKSHGFLFARNIDKKRKDWVGIGYESTFYDPFNAEAGKLFWKQIDTRLNNLGFDAWWLDATEPDMHSNLSLEERKNNMSPTALGSGTRYFNAYSLMNSKSVYEGQRASSPGKRVFILTRSAYAGQQRYGTTTWSGDIVSRWSDFQDQIAAGINFSLSGLPYWTMDIGGFAVENRFTKASGETLNEWREMNTRWFQFGAFCPIFRSHGQYPYREVYNISQPGDAAYESMLYYDNLRYKLLPYIYSLAGLSYLKDYTIMRGLVMDFQNDRNVLNIADQYMFGPSLLINPVYEYKSRNRTMYLPAGTGWFDLYSGARVEGGKEITVDAPLQRIPVFVKEGSIIPAGPPLQYTAEKKADPVTLFVYRGSNGSFDLYEDEGVNYEYEKGSYSVTPFIYDESTRTLKIGERKGSFKNMLEQRTFRIISVGPDHAVGFMDDVQPQEEIKYTGSEITVKLK
jgi:alpha-D-xyloside xylohydrolase